MSLIDSIFLNAIHCLIYHRKILWLFGPARPNIQETHSLISTNTSLMLMAFLALVSTKMAWMESA